jgi:hypothetical protein
MNHCCVCRNPCAAFLSMRMAGTLPLLDTTKSLGTGTQRQASAFRYGLWHSCKALVPCISAPDTCTCCPEPDTACFKQYFATWKVHFVSMLSCWRAGLDRQRNSLLCQDQSERQQRVRWMLEQESGTVGPPATGGPGAALVKLEVISPSCLLRHDLC